KRLQSPVAAQRIIHGTLLPCELRRVENDEIKALPIANGQLQVFEYFALHEGDVSQAVARRVLPAQLDGRLGDIDAEHFACSCPCGMQTKPARVAERIEHPSPRSIEGDRAAILALVQIETGLLPFHQVDEELDTIFVNHQHLRRRPPPENTVLQL